MPRRIDVELTSERADGTWTWRAAGAREPKGVVEDRLVYPDAKVGDVVRAEVEVDVEGIVILSLQPPKEKRDEPSKRIELLGPAREFQPVTTSLVPKRGGDRRGGPRRDGDRADRLDRGDRRDRAGRSERPGAPHRDRPGAERRPEGAGDRPARGSRPRAEGTGDRARATPGSPARGSQPDGGRREPRAERSRPKRLSPASTHRNAMLAALSPEQRPVAEQLLRGGIPAVRRAIEEQNTAARAEGQPQIPGEPLLAMAEELLPRVKLAEWRDRAEAARADVDAIGLRDLRSVVSSSDVANRDESARELANDLRAALERRVNAQRGAWIGEITTALAEGRLVRALRVSSRPPEPTMRFEADLAQRLASAASEQLSAETPSDRWLALLEAVAASPVRTTVKPAGLPADADEALRRAASAHAGRIPALASLLGLTLPPPPTAIRKPPPRPPRPAGQAPPPTAPATAEAGVPPAGVEPGPPADDGAGVSEPAAVTD